MRKLSLLLTLMCIMLTSCENGGGIVEDNNGTISSPQIKLYNEFVEVGYEADIHSISVTSTCSWEAKSINDWISLEDSNGIQGTSDLKFNIERNSKTESREGIIIIENEQYNIVTEFRVRQKAFEPNITVLTESLQYMPEGGSKTVVISSNIVYDISENTEWISCEKIPNGIIIDVENHDGINERHAEIVISNDEYNISKTLIISQSAFLPEIITDAESLDFPFQGGEQRLLIASNIEYEVTANSNWLQCEMHDGSLLISVQPNTKEEKRHTEIIITNSKYDISKTININQHELIKSAANVLLYTSYDNQIIELYRTANFGANIISNTYDNQGIIIFDADITAIGGHAFKDCDNLISVTIPDSVTSIGVHAFDSCKKLREVMVNNYSLETIGDYAFSNCQSLTSFVIPDGVKSIGKDAFYNCSLTYLTIPTKIVNIGESAFGSCENISVVNISDVSAWCQINFSNSSANPLCHGAKLYLNGKELEDIVIPSDIGEVKPYVFFNCSNLTNVVLSDGISKIGDYAFYKCANLNTINMPNSVASIGNSSFYSCSSLTSVTIPNSVTTIGRGAFYGCNIKSVYISNLSAWCQIDFEGTDSNPLGGNTKLYLNDKELTDVVIPNEVFAIKQYAFYSYKYLSSISIGNQVSYIGWSSFEGCKNLTSVSIPNSIIKIEGRAFKDCQNLTNVHIVDLLSWCQIDFSSNTSNPLCNGAKLHINKEELISITIPAEITEIKRYAFYNCSNLLDVSLPNSVTKIGDLAFSGCNITNITLPDSVLEIGSLAFEYCRLTSITIPNNVAKIGNKAFCYCTRLESVYCKPSIPPAGDSNMFSGNTEQRIIYVPRESVSLYKAAYGWKSYADDIVGYDFD